MRLTVGAELHRLVQARLAASGSYLAEVPVEQTVTLGTWELAIQGRCDGIHRPADGPPVVEEIKTLHFRTELFRLQDDNFYERYAWQVRIYAFCLYPHGEAKARVRLVDLSGEDEKLQEVAWSPAQVEAYLRAKLAALLQQARERQNLLAVWRRAAEDLPFPFAQVRPVQREAMKAVEAAVSAGRHLLLAAPTGVGKTAAALYPALRQALASGQRLVFATAKTLQQKLAVDTLSAMNRGSFRSIQLRAKAKMCAHHEVVCHEAFCPFLEGFGLRLAQCGLTERLALCWHLDPAETFAAAREEHLCPFAVQLELLPRALAVVCDYNYVFDPAIALFGRPEDGQLAETILVVDEAHNLVDRAREYFSPRLSRRLVASALALLQPYSARVCVKLREVLAELEETIVATTDEAVGGAEGVAPAEPPLELLRQARLGLDALMLPYFAFKRQQELWLASDPVVAVLLTLARFLELAENLRPELVALAEKPSESAASGERDPCLRLLCLDPAPFVGPILASCSACVAMSATLEPFDFYVQLLGFDPDRTDTLSLPSPFPQENRLILAVDSVDTSYRRRPQAYGPIAELLPELLAPGKNVLVLFPSYRFLQEVAARLTVASHQLLVQNYQDSDSSREEMLAALRQNRQPVALLGVLGGAFAEGVDYPGETLSQVIVVSPALPQVSPERELLKRYFDEKLGQGFAYAYLVPGMTRVVQAAGRLIRSDQDRGVIVLVCRRFLHEPYFSLLPEDWRAQVAQTPSRSPSEEIARFFAQSGNVPAARAW